VWLSAQRIARQARNRQPQVPRFDLFFFSPLSEQSTAQA
jgi:hypothetical protein